MRDIKNPARNGNRSLDALIEHIGEDHLVGWAAPENRNLVADPRDDRGQIRFDRVKQLWRGGHTNPNFRSAAPLGLVIVFFRFRLLDVEAGGLP
jgi:hypothetical protein